MEALILTGGLIYIGVLGFWVMGKIDRFIGQGGFLPDGDEEKGPKLLIKNGQAKICGNANLAKAKAADNIPFV